MCTYGFVTKSKIEITTLRHVVEMAAAGTGVLATVAVFTTMQGLVLVLIYITFLLGTFVDVICE